MFPPSSSLISLPPYRCFLRRFSFFLLHISCVRLVGAHLLEELRRVIAAQRRRGRRGVYREQRVRRSTARCLFLHQTTAQGGEKRERAKCRKATTRLQYLFLHIVTRCKALNYWLGCRSHEAGESCIYCSRASPFTALVCRL